MKKKNFIGKHGFAWIFLILLNLTAYPALSQDLKFSYFTTSDGLSQSWVTCIAQDTLGFMWIGSEIGLNRFDGEHFVVYKSDPSDSSSICDNSIWSMLIDSKGRFWIGTAIGLEQYDFEKGVFIHYLNETEISSSRDVQSITEDTSGDIWIATSSGIGKIDLEHNSYKIQYFPSGVNARVTQLLADSQGVIWVSTKNGGLFTFDRDYKGLKPFDLQYSTEMKPADLEMQLSHVYEDRLGELWVATDAGLLRFDKQRKVKSRYVHIEQDNKTVGDNRIHYITEDANGNLWIAHSNGASVLDNERKNFTHHEFSPDNPHGLNNGYLTFIYKDNSENLWLGTRNAGLNVTYATGNNFKLYRHQPNDFTSLSNNIVKAVLRDRNGHVWLGTDGGGLNELRSDGKFRVHKHNPADRTSLPNDLILSLYEDQAGDIWVGTFGGALSVMKKNTRTFDHFFPDPDNEQKLRTAAVSVMYEDRSHNFWVGTWYGGLHLLDRKKKIFKRFPFKVVGDTGLTDEKVLDILETPDGELIIATGHGLNIYNPVTEKFAQFLNADSIKSSLSGNVCSSICVDPSGQIWIGTENGLNLFNKEKKTFQKFGIKEGLPNESIQGVLSDVNGNLWISTLNGICRFNPATGVVRNYTVQDGLQGSEFITHSYFKSVDGVMLFGGNNGANVIDPRSIRLNTQVPPIVFTKLKVLNQPVRAGVSKEIPKEIAFMNELELPYDKSFFTLEFAALNFANAKANQYAYKLEPFDSDWNYISNERTVTYNGLKPGEYLFSVKGSNNDGIWNTRGASLKIIITPPLWETVWFRVFAVSGVIMVISFAFYFRIRMVKEQKEALEELVQKRTKVIQQQKEEIETQKENIVLQFNEIAARNERIIQQNVLLTEMRKEVNEKNDKLERYNTELESTVRKRTKQLLQINEELDQFVYRSAHDLKGPVSRIMGLCYLGSLEQSSVQITHLLHLMTQCTEEMSQKLGRLMNIHALNKHEIHMKSICYEALLKEVMEEVSKEQHTSGIEFLLKVEAGQYASDRALLFILLKNVIENAVKFRDTSKPLSYIRVSIRQVRTKTIISVVDNGVGIPAPERSRIFDMFVVCHDSIKGFGLGLYEARLIARRLNGTIRVKDRKTNETEFKILLREKSRPVRLNSKVSLLTSQRSDLIVGV
jgi:ligand-binding sensor domain-containing protein/signal transduction histidine kinase